MDYIKRDPILQVAKDLQSNVFGAPLITRSIESAPAEEVAPVSEVLARVREEINEIVFNPNNKFDFIYDSIYQAIDKVQKEYCSEKDT